MSRTTSQSESEVRVLIVDSTKILRDTLAELMEYLPGLRCVGTAQTGAEAVRLAMKRCPDVVLVDTDLPDMSGPRAVQLLRQAYPPVHIVGFSVSPDHIARESLTRAGADAFVPKDAGLDALVGVIHELGLVPEPARGDCEERAGKVA